MTRVTLVKGQVRKRPQEAKAVCVCVCIEYDRLLGFDYKVSDWSLTLDLWDSERPRALFNYNG